MVILYLILFIICIWGLKIRKNAISKQEYLDKTQTKAVQGIFVVLVLFSHFSSYVSLDNVLDNSFILISNHIGQLMVTMFLFYSGYGIMCSIKEKGETYIKGFLSNRVLHVYGRFFVSVILFILVNLALGLLGDKYSLIDCLLAFTAWTSIGNSTWFMFCTFALYLFVFIAFRPLLKKDLKISLVVLTVLTLIYILVFSIFINKGVWWYNTILCFPLGMWFGFYVEKIDEFMQGKNRYIISLIITCAIFLVCYLLQDKFLYGYCLLAIAFTVLVLLVTMRVKIGNKILAFFGSHVFSIYMLQRLTYIIFDNIITNQYLFFVVCFVLTILIALIFDYCYAKITKRINFKKKKKFNI